MKKTSNWLISVGLLLIICIYIFRFVELQAIGVPNIESKYWWWALALVVVIVTVIKSTSGHTTTSVAWKKVFGFAKSLLSFTIVTALICVILGGLFYSGLWLKTKIDNSIPSSSNSESGCKIVEIHPGLSTIIPVSATAHSNEYAPPEMTRVEFLDEHRNPIPVQINGQVQYSWITGPGVDNQMAYDFRAVNYIRFSAESDSGCSYSFRYIEN